MPDATHKMQQDDHFVFTKIRVRGPDVAPKGKRGQTGQHGMRTYTFEGGAVILDEVKDASAQWTLEESGGEEKEEDVQEEMEWRCPYKTCLYDAQPYMEPWRRKQAEEEAARKQAERDRRGQRMQNR